MGFSPPPPPSYSRSVTIGVLDGQRPTIITLPALGRGTIAWWLTLDAALPVPVDVVAAVVGPIAPIPANWIENYTYPVPALQVGQWQGAHHVDAGGDVQLAAGIVGSDGLLSAVATWTPAPPV